MTHCIFFIPKLCYIGVKSLIIHGEKLLVLLKKNYNDDYIWDIPGGRIDEHDTIKDALEREVIEELGSQTIVVVKNLIHASRLETNLKDGHGLVFLFYHVEIPSLSIQLSGEHESYTWLGREEIQQATHEGAIIDEGYRMAFLKTLSQYNPKLIQ